MSSGPAMYSQQDETRLVDEAGKPGGSSGFRSAWRRDFGRVVHSAAFRRLQGKTQLFYGSEGVFRNRLTHSMEVAQIAKTLALRLNHEFEAGINEDIVEIAGLVHDLGHPPFGHNGERALDDVMLQHGGFEGNAQTFRILAALEKRVRVRDSSESANGGRVGLNLTARVLASTLKYDSEIPSERIDGGVQKGYYCTEAGVVDFVKKNVLGTRYAEYRVRQVRTVECQVMDLADDIAYSTYDLEDAWKAGFLSPLDLLAVPQPKLSEIGKRVRRTHRLEACMDDEVQDVLHKLVVGDLERSFSEFAAQVDEPLGQQHLIAAVGVGYQDMRQLAANGYRRTLFTSNLIEQLVGGVAYEVDTHCPPLSRAYFDDETLLAVEALKQYAYVSIIGSPRLQIPEYRGYTVVKTIFEACSSPHGYTLLPEDFRESLAELSNEGARKRMVCDFVAGMTDVYAVGFFNRLTFDTPATIFGPSI